MVGILVLIYFVRLRLRYTIKANLISEFWSRDILNLLLWKGMGQASRPIFVWFFKKKYFSCSVLLTDHVSRSHSLIAFDSKMLGNLCIVIFCCPICDVTNFEINLSFLIKTFFYILAKKSGQKGKYFQKEKSF